MLSSLGLFGIVARPAAFGRGLLGFLSSPLIPYRMLPNKTSLPAGRSSKSGGWSSALRFAATFAAVYLVTTFAMQYLLPERFRPSENGTTTKPPLVLTPARLKVPLGRNVTLKLLNALQEPITLPNRCPAPPLLIERKQGESFVAVHPGESVTPPCVPLMEMPAGSQIDLDLSPWKYAAFAEPGTYRVTLPPEDAITATPPSAEIIVREPNVFVRIFRAFISKPLLSAMVLMAAVIPGHDLGLSIILLTILVKLLLYLPSKHAMESQRKLQKLQPKLDEIKAKFAGDQQKITEETMKLWRTEKINPLQSCLPTVLQIPVLLGLFFIIRDSGALPLARHLLYGPFQNLDWTFDTLFLGANLTRIPFAGLTWSLSLTSLFSHLRAAPVPLLTAILQFFQMKLAFAASKKKKTAEPLTKDSLLANLANPQAMMLYLLPVMIFVISGGLPTAVSLYWITSTIFAIGQQVMTNRKA